MRPAPSIRLQATTAPPRRQTSLLQDPSHATTHGSTGDCGGPHLVRSDPEGAVHRPLTSDPRRHLPDPNRGRGDSITYNVVNYPALQNGFTVSGTITTNGATGTDLPTNDITSWDITITQASTTILTFNPSNSTTFLNDTFNATTTELNVASGGSIEFETPSPLTEIAWSGTTTNTRYESYDVNYAENAGYLWNAANYDPASQPVASTTVPEPSSAVLAVIGAVSVVACGLVRRRRRAPAVRCRAHPADQVSGRRVPRHARTVPLPAP